MSKATEIFKLQRAVFGEYCYDYEETLLQKEKRNITDR